MSSKIRTLATFFGPFYYREISRIADPRQARRHFLWYFALNCTFSLELLRCLILLYSIIYEDDRWFEYDVVCKMRRQIMFFDPYMIFCMACLFLFLALHNTIYYYASRTFIWRLIQELILTNTNDILESNRPAIASLGKQFTLEAVLHHPMAWWQLGAIFLDLWKKDDSLNKHPIVLKVKLAYFGAASPRTRIRSFLVYLFWEWSLTLVSICMLLFSLVGVPFYAIRLWAMNLHLLHWAISLLDVASSFYIAWLGFKLGCLALYAQLITLYTTNSVYRELNGNVERRLASKEQLFSRSAIRASPQRLWQFRREHARLTEYVLRTDNRFWSAGLCNFYVNNIPVNVYVVQYLAFRNADQTMRLLFYYILGIQLFAITLSMLPAAQTSSLLHASRRYMCSMQASLQIRHLWLKLKYMAFQEQVNNGNTIGFHIGPFFAITKRTIIDVSRASKW